MEKCCRREGRSERLHEFSGQFLKQENFEWKKKRGGKKRKEKRKRGSKGKGRMVGVRDRRSNAATVEWMAYRWRTRPPNSIRGENSFQMFSSCKPWCLFSGPRPAWFRCTYLLPVSTSRSRSSNSIPLSTCRLSHLWKHALGNTYEHIVWTSSK